MGHAPSRSKIQLALSALQSSLSLKHSTPHNLQDARIKPQGNPADHQGSTAQTRPSRPRDGQRQVDGSASGDRQLHHETMVRAVPWRRAPAASLPFAVGPIQIMPARRVRSCGAGRGDQGPHLQLHAPRYGLLHGKVLHTRRARTHTQDMSESGQQRAGRSRLRRSDIARPAAAEGQGSPRRSRPGHGGHVEVRPDPPHHQLSALAARQRGLPSAGRCPGVVDIRTPAAASSSNGPHDVVGGAPVQRPPLWPKGRFLVLR
jgi:hypothetical protein